MAEGSLIQFDSTESNPQNLPTAPSPSLAAIESNQCLPSSLPSLPYSSEQLEQKCYRISHIPREWSEEKVFQALDERYNIDTLPGFQFSLYLSPDGREQTGLLLLDGPREFHNGLIPKDKTCVTLEIMGAVTTMDTHFYGLTPLNDPKDPDNIIVDVVAVTGLGGHAYGSWRHHDSQYMWLRDFLSNYIEGSIRILTYGYDSSLLATNVPESSIPDYSRGLIQHLEIARRSDPHRPLVFIGHSLGCIIILKALSMCRTQVEQEALLNATHTFLFFGAPHRGIRTEDMEAMVLDVHGEGAKALELLQQLREDSEFLTEQAEDFAFLWEGRHVISFYEAHLTPALRKSCTSNGSISWSRSGELVNTVRRNSSLLDIPQEIVVPVFEDHSEMVKFITWADPTYMSVVLHMQDAVDDIVERKMGIQAPGADGEGVGNSLHGSEADVCQR